MHRGVLRSPELDLSRLRILLVEDNAFMRRLLRTMLHGIGIRDIVEAETGAGGFELFCTARPDVVVTDWEMPMMDGLGMTRFMRQNGWSRDPFVPILMVTRHTERRRVIEALQAGVSDVLAKPLSAGLLLQRIIHGTCVPTRFIKTASYFGPDRRKPQPGLDLDAPAPGLQIFHPPTVLSRLTAPIDTQDLPLTQAGEITGRKPPPADDFDTIQVDLDKFDPHAKVPA